jgi:hypothetical protein
MGVSNNCVLSTDHNLLLSFIRDKCDAAVLILSVLIGAVAMLLVRDPILVRLLVFDDCV